MQEKAAQAQLEEAQRQYQENLILCRQSLARLQKEDPVSAAAMPGINGVEFEDREKDVVEDIGGIIYSKRYSDLSHQYR